MTYKPGTGLCYTSALTVPDIGNVPNPDRVRNPGGIPGRMNGVAAGGEGTIYYVPSPTPADVEAVAELCLVGNRAVERWFGIADVNGRRQFRNCVPIQSSNFGNVPGALGTRLCSMSTDTRRRCILAACVAVQGGIYRIPLYTGGDRKAGDRPGSPVPYQIVTGWNDLAECVEDVEQLLDGEIDYILMVGWVQITIEADSGGGWNVVIYHNYPVGNEYKEKTVEGECPG